MNTLTKVMVVATALFFALALVAQETAPGHGRGTSEVQQSAARSPQAVAQ
jgi:preprotein translocase subunit SecG